MRDSFFKFEALIVVLVIMTAGVISWQHWGMNRVFIVSPAHDFVAWADADKEGGGDSIAEFTQTDSYSMHCKLKKTIRAPFCNLFVRLSKNNTDGIDLSIYKELKLTLQYNSTENDSLHIGLNHFFPPQKNETLSSYYKPNQTNLNPIKGLHTYTIKLSDFYVASWWIFLNKVPLEKAHVDLRNVMDLIISTGENHEEHEVDMAIVRAEFIGKWIEAETLYRYLLLFWVGLIIIYAVKRTYYLRQRLNAQKNQAQELASLNELLDIRGKHLESITKHDDLTGAYNLEGMRDILSTAINNKKHNGAPLSALLIEPDYLHRINDQLGRDNRDKLLCNLAQHITSNSNANFDLVRWGNEEFLLLCHNTDIEAAATFSNYLCKSIRETKLIKDRTITCSIGVAEMNGDDISELFKQVDNALYRAKQTGRNRCVVAS